jgi:DNA polymerase bacteriophage-type
MTVRLWWDLETWSETPINDGAHRYAEGAEILLFAWAVDDGPVRCVDVTEHGTIPPSVLDAVSSVDEYWGHNSGGFDRTVLKHAMPEMYRAMSEEKHRDTMVQALCHGLPGSLATLCDIFRLDADKAKDKRGRQLIRMFCMPQPANQKLRRKTRETHPVEWAELIEYAKSDITSMRELHKKMPKWNYPNNEFELRLWQLDQQINNGGVYVDLELAKTAIEAVDVAQAGLANDVSEATDGAVTSATQRDKLLNHILAEYGVSLPDMRADTLERRLADPNLPDSVRDLISIRLMASTSSVSKFKRVLRSTSSDGYLRGVIQFSGAGRTARDAGRLFQPQNLMRPTLSADVIETGIESIKAGCADLVTDNVMELCANAMRGVIIAPPGKKLVVADLSNIEGRVVAWLAGEEWKLQAFRDFDAGIGEDLYKVAYGKAFKVSPASVTKQQRQVGKVMELFLAYQGGVGAFVTGAATYGIELDELDADIPADVWAETENFYEWMVEQKRPTFGLKPRTFAMCDSLKRLWRRAHPNIESLWSHAETAARVAVEEPDEYAHARKVTAIRKGNWLRIVLPSGRSLSYPAPRVEEGKISFMGINQYSRKWSRISTYGGKLVENMTQAVARDVFKANAFRITEAGYEIKLPVHDEDICYAPDRPEFNPKHLSALLATNPPWAPDLPLAAAGFEGYRYKKAD